MTTNRDREIAKQFKKRADTGMDYEENWSQALSDARAEERERCAEVAEKWSCSAMGYGWTSEQIEESVKIASEGIAKAIRELNERV